MTFHMSELNVGRKHVTSTICVDPGTQTLLFQFIQTWDDSHGGSGDV